MSENVNVNPNPFLNPFLDDSGSGVLEERLLCILNWAMISQMIDERLGFGTRIEVIVEVEVDVIHIASICDVKEVPHVRRSAEPIRVMLWRRVVLWASGGKKIVVLGQGKNTSYRDWANCTVQVQLVEVLRTCNLNAALGSHPTLAASMQLRGSRQIQPRCLTSTWARMGVNTIFHNAFSKWFKRLGYMREFSFSPLVVITLMASASHLLNSCQLCDRRRNGEREKKVFFG